MIYLDVIISCIFDANTIIFSYSFIGQCECEDTDQGVYDRFGDSCLWYYWNANECGSYDDDDFTANTMCCGCNGGQSGSKQCGKYYENENKL